MIGAKRRSTVRHFSLSSSGGDSTAALTSTASSTTLFSNDNGDSSENDIGNDCPSSPIPKLRHSESSEHMLLEAATSEVIDEILRLNENDMNLSELFLDGDDRSSAALAYSCYAGCIPRYELPRSGGASAPGAEGTSFHGGISPATKSEGGTKYGVDVQIKENGSASSQTNNSGANFVAHRMPAAPHQQLTLLPYTRAKPLPIPTLRVSCLTNGFAMRTDGTNNNSSGNGINSNSNQNAITGSQTLAEAIATAAAIATNSPPLTAVASGGIDQPTAAALSVQPTKAPTGSLTLAPSPLTLLPSPSIPPSKEVPRVTSPMSSHSNLYDAKSRKNCTQQQQPNECFTRKGAPIVIGTTLYTSSHRNSTVTACHWLSSPCTWWPPSSPNSTNSSSNLQFNNSCSQTRVSFTSSPLSSTTTNS